MHGVTGTCNRENCSCRLKGPEIQTKVVLILYLLRPMQDECVESYMDEHRTEKKDVSSEQSMDRKYYKFICKCVILFKLQNLIICKNKCTSIYIKVLRGHLKVGPPFVFLSYII